MDYTELIATITSCKNALAELTIPVILSRPVGVTIQAVINTLNKAEQDIREKGVSRPMQDGCPTE